MLALLFIACFLQKRSFIFTLDKSGPAKTWPAGPAPTPMYRTVVPFDLPTQNTLIKRYNMFATIHMSYTRKAE